MVLSMSKSFFIRISLCFFIIVLMTAWSSDGGFYKEGKKFDLGRTIFAVGGAALMIGAAAACADSPGCLDGLGGSTPNYLTGGPDYDWDKFSNNQFRCRNIANGQFEPDYLCESMPKDDDRWPNN